MSETDHTFGAELLVCVKCRRGQEVPESETRPGAALFAALQADPPQRVRVRPVECLQNCESGCTIALRGPGKWSYIYGNLHETSHIDIVREGAELYAATDDGLIAWRARPEHFKKNCVARLPAPDMTCAGDDV